MENKFTEELAAAMSGFTLPRYAQLPDMGLYLEQTVEYINRCLEPLGCFEITGSMIRNYVKKGLIKNPVAKQYYREQISYLISITLMKPILSLENIKRMFAMQQRTYTGEKAYNYFCMELENVLYYRFGVSGSLNNVGDTNSLEKEMLRSTITAISHMIYLDVCLALDAGSAAESDSTTDSAGTIESAGIGAGIGGN